MDRKNHITRHGLARALGLVGISAWLVLAFLIPCAAEPEESDLEEILQQTLQELDTSAWEELLDADRERIVEMLEDLASGEKDFAGFWEELFRVPLQDMGKKQAQTASILIGVGLLSGVMPHWLRDPSVSSWLRRIFGAFCAAVLCVCLTQLLQDTFAKTGQLLSFLEAAQSVMTVLAAALGAQATGAAAGAVGSFFFALFNRFLSGILFPAWMAVSFLRLTALFTEDPLLPAVAGTVSRISQWLMGLGCGAAVVIMKAQMGFAAASDSLTRRTLRSAVEQGLPVVGGYLRDMVDTTLLSADLAQNALGSLSILAVVSAVLPLCVQLLGAYAALQLGSLGAGEDPLGSGIREISSLLLLCLGVLVLCAFWVIFCLGQLVACGTQVLYA